MQLFFQACFLLPAEFPKGSKAFMDPHSEKMSNSSIQKAFVHYCIQPFWSSQMNWKASLANTSWLKYLEGLPQNFTCQSHSAVHCATSLMRNECIKVCHISQAPAFFLPLHLPEDSRSYPEMSGHVSRLTHKKGFCKAWGVLGPLIKHDVALPLWTDKTFQGSGLIFCWFGFF